MWKSLTDHAFHSVAQASHLRRVAQESSAAVVDVVGTNQAEDGWRFILKVFQTGDGRWFASESVMPKVGPAYHTVAEWQEDQPTAVASNPKGVS